MKGEKRKDSMWGGVVDEEVWKTGRSKALQECGRDCGGEDEV